MKRDVLIGLVAGMVAVVVAGRRGPTAPVPAGVYQASVNEGKVAEAVREMRPTGPSQTKAARAKLDARIENFEVVEGRLEGVVAYVADVSGLDVTVDWKAVGNLRDAPVTVRLKDVTAGEALRASFESAAPGRELSYEFSPDRLRVTTRAEAERDLVARVYDVRDIVLRMIDSSRAFDTRPVPPVVHWRRPPGGTGLFGGMEPPTFADFVITRKEAMDVLVQYLQEQVDASSWRDAGGSAGAMRVFDTMLVVVQTRENQDHVALLLEWVREVMK
jgi:hypothetical protein